MVILLFYGASVVWMKIFWIVKFVYFLYSIWIWYSKCFVYQAYPKHAVFSANILYLVFVLKIISEELFLDVFFSFEMDSLNCLLWSFVYFVFGLFAFSYSLEGILCILGFPVVKNPPANAGDKRDGFDPWVGKIPWRREWQFTPVFLPEEPIDRWVWWATVHRVAQSQTWLKWFSTCTLYIMYQIIFLLPLKFIYCVFIAQTLKHSMFSSHVFVLVCCILYFNP